MKDRNQYLLDTIDIIEESVIDAEMDVLSSLKDVYVKCYTLLEYSNNEDVNMNEYTIFQEAAVTEQQPSKKESWFKNVFKAIKSAILFVIRLIKKGVNKVLTLIRNKSNKKNDDLIYDYYDNGENSNYHQLDSNYLL